MGDSTGVLQELRAAIFLAGMSYQANKYNSRKLKWENKYKTIVSTWGPQELRKFAVNLPNEIGIEICQAFQIYIQRLKDTKSNKRINDTELRLHRIQEEFKNQEELKNRNNNYIKNNLNLESKHWIKSVFEILKKVNFVDEDKQEKNNIRDRAR